MKKIAKSIKPKVKKEVIDDETKKKKPAYVNH